MIDDRDRRQRAVRQLLGNTQGRDQVVEALDELLTEAMSFGPRDLPQSADREWLRGATAVPLQHATDAALEALAVGMTQSLDRAPHDLFERLTESRRCQDLGWE